MTSSPPGIMRMLSGFLDGGLVLNLGSAESGSFWDAGGSPINVDVAMPPAPSHPFVRADAGSLPFRGEAFQGLLAKDVLEHVDDIHQAMSEIRRTVRPGSRLVATVPRAIPRAVWADPTHRRGFTKQALVTLMEQHGIKVEVVRRIGAVPGVGRFGLERYLLVLLRVPGIGHFFGTNWLTVARVL
ncbi:MAG TPA: methyltransferase domain-containing protein [Acidimicrobiales bacterium]|nr:methyltransferase domain-containing protein [Acidimicrobiales bacterium]